MKTTPPSSNTRPNGVKSKSPNGSSPRSRSIAPARMFGGVPTSVAVPPRIAPNASGMNSRAGARCARRARLATAGMSTAVAAMLFMNIERTPATSMTATISGTSRLPTKRWMAPPTRSATPVCISPALTMKIDSIVITADDAKPEKASGTAT